ncbi:Type IV fimbrial assembly, ATPase PilB [Stenotrophomonas maltophilia]|nr:Type IV fimbrial assembly, ATPase PilB [Stenotrophomonas maltophilia]
MNAVTTANLVGITGLARRLVQDGALDEASARDAMAKAAAARQPLPTWFAQNKVVGAAQLAAANAVEFGMPLFDVSTFDASQNAMSLVSEELLRKHNVLPLFKRGGKLFVGTSNPTHSLDEIKFHTNLVVEPILVDEDQIRRTLEQWHASHDTLGDALGGDDDGMGNLDVAAGDEDLGAGGDSGIDAKGDDTPVVKFVNKVLVDAIRKGASDIHFEPYEDDYRVRLRIDGLLKMVARAPVKLNQRIAARLKVMAQLDIAEKRVPQDGRIKLNLSKTKQIDFRVSTLPTLFGEKVVLRILDGSAAKLGIDKLGYEPDQQKLFLEAIHKPYGMVLVTGPTGSGKTVSLYTALGILNDETRNISTAEDPVEIRLPGVNQVQQNNKRGMTFAGQVDAVVVGLQAQLDVRVCRLECSQPRQQPAGGEGADHAQRQYLAGRSAGVARDAGRDALERFVEYRIQRRALVGQRHAARQAMEQADAEPVLQPPDLVAQRGLADAQLERGTGEVLVAGGGFESAQRVQRQGRVQHRKAVSQGDG